MSPKIALSRMNALCFLKSIINDEFLQTIEYQAGEEFELSELKGVVTAQNYYENQDGDNTKEKMFMLCIELY